MNATIDQSGDYVVVRLSGHLDYFSCEPLQKTCMERFVGQKVIFNLSELSFVGSMGITPFVTTVGQLNRSLSFGVKLCGVSSEFRKVFESDQESRLEFYDTEERAMHAFVAPQIQVAIPVVVENEEPFMEVESSSISTEPSLNSQVMRAGPFSTEE